MDKNRAVLVTFSIRSNGFASPYERSMFYRQLYGWKQIVRREETRYSYEKPGLLGKIPHLKIDQSLFLIAAHHLKEVERFFKSLERENKVTFETFDVLLNSRLAKRLERLERIEKLLAEIASEE